MKRTVVHIYEQLISIGETDLADNILCAYAALTGKELKPESSSYSAMMRKLRKGDVEVCRAFQESFKSAFEEALLEDTEAPEQVALLQAIKDCDIE